MCVYINTLTSCIHDKHIVNYQIAWLVIDYDSNIDLIKNILYKKVYIFTSQIKKK